MAERLPPRLLRAYEARGAQTLRAVAHVARGVRPAGATFATRPTPAFVRDLKRREAEALRVWSQRQRRLLDAERFEQRWIAQGRIGGQENDVHLEGPRVFKRNNLTFHLGYIEFFDRLALHNLLFPGAPLRLEGFVEGRDALLLPVMSQPAIRAQRGATRREVEAFMRQLDFVHIRHDDYRHEEGILVEDLHDENVFIDSDGDVIVIDPVIYVVKAGIGGTRRRSKSPSHHPSRHSLIP